MPAKKLLPLPLPWMPPPLLLPPLPPLPPPQPLLPLPRLSLSPLPLPLLPPLQPLLSPPLSLSPLPSLSVLPPPLPGHVHCSFSPPRHVHVVLLLVHEQLLGRSPLPQCPLGIRGPPVGLKLQI